MRKVKIIWQEENVIGSNRLIFIKFIEDYSETILGKFADNCESVIVSGKFVWETRISNDSLGNETWVETDKPKINFLNRKFALEAFIEKLDPAEQEFFNENKYKIVYE